MGIVRSVGEAMGTALMISSAACLPSPAGAEGGSSTSAAAMCGAWHPDDDGDGFGAADIAIDTCNPSPGWVMDDRDCYDGNADARPDQIEYFAVHRGDGTFDYDCDGFATVFERDLGGCHGEPDCPTDKGWRTGLAGCGDVSDWVTECSRPIGDAPMCTWEIELKGQVCR